MNLEATDEDIEEEMVDEMEKEEELAHSLHLCVERIQIPVFRVREQVALQVMVNLATMAVCLPLCRLLLFRNDKQALSLFFWGFF